MCRTDKERKREREVDTERERESRYGFTWCANASNRGTRFDSQVVTEGNQERNCRITPTQGESQFMAVAKYENGLSPKDLTPIGGAYRSTTCRDEIM